MIELRWWAVYAWLALPTVMYGGYALLQLVVKNEDSPFRRTWFRAGHAHAGVLLLGLLLFINYLTLTELTGWIKHLACAVFVAGIFSQSGGFFVHMLRGEEGQRSFGTMLTSLGVLLLSMAVAILIYGLIVMYR